MLTKKNKQKIIEYAKSIGLSLSVKDNHTVKFGKVAKLALRATVAGALSPLIPIYHP